MDAAADNFEVAQQFAGTARELAPSSVKTMEVDVSEENEKSLLEKRVAERVRSKGADIPASYYQRNRDRIHPMRKKQEHMKR